MNAACTGSHVSAKSSCTQSSGSDGGDDIRSSLFGLCESDDTDYEGAAASLQAKPDERNPTLGMTLQRCVSFSFSATGWVAMH